MFKNTLKERNSYKIRKNNKGSRPILTVYKSNKNIYAQIIDMEGKVLVSFSSKTKETSKNFEGKTGLEIAKEVGKGIAEVAIKNNIKDVVFNKGPYLYIGRVKALAESARENGLNF